MTVHTHTHAHTHTHTHVAPADADLAERVWRGLGDLVIHRNNRKAEASAAVGLPFVRLRALRRLLAGPLTLRELAASMGTDPPYATVTVDDLERRGYVTREPHPSDRRARLVTLTPAGADAAREAERILYTPPELLVALPPADLAALDRIVTRLLGAG